MNRFLTRKNLIMAGVGIAVVTAIIAGGSFLITYLSQRSVTFTFSSEVASIQISKEDLNECDGRCELDDTIRLEKSGQIRLTDGTYYVIPTGDMVDESSISIVVGKDTTTFTIQPDYSQDYLANLLASEITSIHNALLAAYPVVTQQYSVSGGLLYKRGEWYATTLYPLGSDASDVYYAILHKVDGKWLLAAQPSLYFSYAEHPSIPTTIISAVNSGSL